jgi:hypothetical protein
VPANLSPEYKAAEAAFRKTRDPHERLVGLREMLRTIPKHKGTEHLQADIKARIKDLADQLEGGTHKGASRGGPALVIRPEGAAQVVLLGPPNAGKSALHARLTGSSAHVGPYPYTTQHPEAGMLPFEDVHFQLLDLPPVATEHPLPWLVNTLQTADAALLVVDLGEPSCVEQLQAVQSVLAQQRVTLIERWPAGAPPAGGDDDDPFALHLPALLLATKVDGVADPEAELQVLRELSGTPLPMLAVSASPATAWASSGMAVPRAGHRARVHQDPRPRGRQAPPVHAAPRADRGRGRATRARRRGAHAALRARVGPLGFEGSRSGTSTSSRMGTWWSCTPEHAGPPQVRIPECAARRMPNERG